MASGPEPPVSCLWPQPFTQSCHASLVAGQWVQTPPSTTGVGGMGSIKFHHFEGLASNLVALHDHVLLKPSVTHDDRKFPLKWRNYPEQRKGLWLLTTKNTEAPGGKMPLGQMPGGYKQSPAGGDTRASVQTHWAFRAVTWTSAPPCAQKGEPRMEGCPPPSA